MSDFSFVKFVQGLAGDGVQDVDVVEESVVEEREAEKRELKLVKGFHIRRKSGRCCSGAERDGGVKFHAVLDAGYPSWEEALCGTVPGSRGNGWADAEEAGSGREVSCPRCMKRLEKMGN